MHNISSQGENALSTAMYNNFYSSTPFSTDIPAITVSETRQKLQNDDDSEYSDYNPLDDNQSYSNVTDDLFEVVSTINSTLTKEKSVQSVSITGRITISRNGEADVIIPLEPHSSRSARLIIKRSRYHLACQRLMEEEEEEEEEADDHKAIIKEDTNYLHEIDIEENTHVQRSALFNGYANNHSVEDEHIYDYPPDKEQEPIYYVPPDDNESHIYDDPFEPKPVYYEISDLHQPENNVVSFSETNDSCSQHDEQTEVDKETIVIQYPELKMVKDLPYTRPHRLPASSRYDYLEKNYYYKESTEIEIIKEDSTKYVSVAERRKRYIDDQVVPNTVTNKHTTHFRSYSKEVRFPPPIVTTPPSYFSSNMSRRTEATSPVLENNVEVKELSSPPQQEPEQYLRHIKSVMKTARPTSLSSVNKAYQYQNKKNDVHELKFSEDPYVQLSPSEQKTIYSTMKKSISHQRTEDDEKVAAKSTLADYRYFERETVRQLKKNYATSTSSVSKRHVKFIDEESSSPIARQIPEYSGYHDDAVGETFGAERNSVNPGQDDNAILSSPKLFATSLFYSPKRTKTTAACQLREESTVAEHKVQFPKPVKASAQPSSQWQPELIEDFRKSEVFQRIQAKAPFQCLVIDDEIESRQLSGNVLGHLVGSSGRQLASQSQQNFVKKDCLYNLSYIRPRLIHLQSNYSMMPELVDEIAENNMNGLVPENELSVRWDPTELINSLYDVDYNPRIEQKRSRFRNMEGHLEIPNSDITVPGLEKDWKSVYFRTKDSRLQWFATNYADEHPTGELPLWGAEIDINKADYTISIVTKAPKAEQKRLTVKIPSNVFEKWRQAILSHAESNVYDTFVQPVQSLQHDENVIIIEFGISSVRGGVLTQKPSLPQAFFPAVGLVTELGEVFVGVDAYNPDIRQTGALQRPFEADDSSVKKYKLNKSILNACIQKVAKNLKIDPTQYTVLMSISQSIPNVFNAELLKILIEENNFKQATIARQPILILYSYDVTTGVVVDIGERLNIIPVIDEYLVESAIISLPFGAHQIRDCLAKHLTERNNGLYSYQSPVEQTILRYIIEHACHVSTDSDKDNTDTNLVDLTNFKLPPRMEKIISVNKAAFQATEGLFDPKEWNLKIKGLHHLIHNAIQQSPIDSRRQLYKNIYLSGGISLLPGIAERLENELSKLAPGSIHVQVYTSPWRYHAAYLGSQVLASGKQFSKCCVTKQNLSDFLEELKLSSITNGN